MVVQTDQWKMIAVATVFRNLMVSRGIVMSVSVLCFIGDESCQMVAFIVDKGLSFKKSSTQLASAVTLGC